MRIGQRIREALQRVGLLPAFLLLVLALSLLSNRFLTVSNLTVLVRQATINGIIAVGMTMVILTAGIDLSVGSVLALTAVVTADMLRHSWPVGLAMLAGLALGAALGLVNGLLITRVRIPPFIATLGMLAVGRGLTLTYTKGQPITGLPPSFTFWGTGSLGPLPLPILIAALVFTGGYLLLTRTRFGEYIYALGNNVVAARFTGISTEWYITSVYVFTGLLAALAGMLLIGRLNSAPPTIGEGYEFDAIAAVVVGGTALSGGEGGVGGTLIGALLIAVLTNGLNLLNVSSLYEQVVRGVVIALALLFYRAVR